jgi:membrane protein implicated in regulation of membrane protease activity
MELLLPTAFLESALGVSALIVALLTGIVPTFSGQVVLWMVLSLLMFWGLRRFVPKTTPPVLRDATEARTLTAIPAGRTGRVLYEGNSWQARCSDDEVAIAPDQSVFVVGRQGNTLIVLPENILKAESPS